MSDEQTLADNTESLLYFHLLCILDLDECAKGLDWCDNNAICTNTVGGFNCTCREGWTSIDAGKTCDGKLIHLKQTSVVSLPIGLVMT